MRIGLVVDATCDLPHDFLRENDIRVLPIHLHIGDELVIDRRIPDTMGAFLKRVQAGGLPESHTSPVGAEQLQPWILEELVERYDLVYCMTVAAARSGIYEQTAQAATTVMPKAQSQREIAGHSGDFTLRVIDSETAFSGQGVLAAEAVRLLKAGAHPNAIRTMLEKLRSQIGVYLVPNDLDRLRNEALKKGDNRKGAAIWLKGAALGLGSMLDVKPLVELRNGVEKVHVGGKGFAKAADKLFKFLAERVDSATLEAPHLCISYAGDMQDLKQMPAFQALEALCPKRGVSLYLAPLSMTGMINLGAGALAAAFAGANDGL